LFSESQILRKITKLRFAMDVKREHREAALGPLTDSAETSWSVRASSGKKRHSGSYQAEDYDFCCLSGKVLMDGCSPLVQAINSLYLWLMLHNHFGSLFQLAP
jgi:hypothetical protein